MYLTWVQSEQEEREVKDIEDFCSQETLDSSLKSNEIVLPFTPRKKFQVSSDFSPDFSPKSLCVDKYGGCNTSEHRRLFYAERKALSEEMKIEIGIELEFIQKNCPPHLKMQAYETQKTAKLQCEFLSVQLKDAEMNFRMADSKLDEVKATFFRQKVLLERLASSS